MYTQDRHRFRQVFIDVHARRLRGEPLQPLEQHIAEVILAHPEYHALLSRPEQALDADFTPEQGLTNPFLHMAMHLALREQVSTDRPPGIRAAWIRLSARHGEHEAEHRMLECLGQSLWEAQRAGRAPDEAGYLACVQSL